MKRLLSFAIVPLFMLFLGLGLATSQSAFAQDHVVSPSDLQKDVAAASASREQNRQQLQNFVSSPEAQRALRSAHIDSQQVKNAVSRLDDSDLARLSARSEKAQKDFAAGTLSDRDLIIILVAIAALILIIVAVR
jgi:biopolymer transport protein ExbB/TolQ